MLGGLMNAEKIFISFGNEIKSSSGVSGVVFDGL